MSVLNYGDAAARLVSQRIAGPVATTALLKALPASSRCQGMYAMVTADGSTWWFNESSTATASAYVLVPDAGDGRWEAINVGSSSPVHLVRAASTADVSLAACSTSFDGLTLVAGDRVLLKDQSPDTENGIYVVGTVVAGPVAPLVRATDFDVATEIQSGALVSVGAGTTNGNTLYQLTTDGAITVGSTSIAFGLVISTALTSDAPEDPGVAAASAGVATTAARADHLHHLDALNLAGGTSYVTGRLPLINIPLGLTRTARGVVFANVANLAAFTVAGNDGLTYVEGERVLLTAQTTAAQCGLYVVGAVGGGTAALTRVTDLFTGDVAVNGHVIEVSEGTIWAGSTWKSMATGTVTIGTNDPIYYPRVCKGILTLASGTYTLGATEGLFLFSTTKSNIQVMPNTAGGTVTSTITYGSTSASRTAGKSGVGAAIVLARVAAGTINVADNSTVDWICCNW